MGLKYPDVQLVDLAEQSSVDRELTQPMSDAQVRDQGDTILNPRQALVIPFDYGKKSWTDLRLGVFLSLTPTDENVTNLAETLPKVGSEDRVFIGFYGNLSGLDSTLSSAPLSAETSFIGLVGEDTAAPTSDSVVVASSGGTATTGTKYWRAHSNTKVRVGSRIDEVTHNAGQAQNGLYLPQDPVAAGGIAAAYLVKMTRPTITSLAITGYYEAAANDNGVLYSDAPHTGELKSYLRTATFVSAGSTTLSNADLVPIGVYVYWPFTKSNLKVHQVVLDRVA